MHSGQEIQDSWQRQLNGNEVPVNACGSIADRHSHLAAGFELWNVFVHAG